MLEKQKTKQLIFKTDREQYKSEKQRTIAYKELLGSDEGQTFLMDFLINMGFFGCQEVKDEREAYISHGKRLACNFLLNYLAITGVSEE